MALWPPAWLRLAMAADRVAWTSRSVVSEAARLSAARPLGFPAPHRCGCGFGFQTKADIGALAFGSSSRSEPSWCTRCINHWPSEANR